MFCFFKNDELINFWSNSIGDVFADLTCQALKLNKQEIDLVFYHGLDSIPDHFEIDASKKLIIKKRTVTQVENQDEEGKQIITEVESFSVEKEIEPDHFMSKGLMLKSC